jgi:hypothetical protein
MKSKTSNQKESDVLSGVEAEVFDVMITGSSNKQIANQLNMKDGYVRKIKTRIRKKVTRELKKAADMLRLQYTDDDIDRENGLLKSFDWVNNTWVALVFTAYKGILAYYEHECSSNCEDICLETLDLICKERCVDIDKKIKSLPIRLQYEYVFETIRKKGREI